MVKRNKIPIVILVAFFILIIGASTSLIMLNEKKEKLVIFHAGSLKVVVSELAQEFERIYPDVKVESESAGSLVSIRKITESNRVADVLISADYKLIDDYMVNSNPKWANWSIVFAKNEIVIAFTNESKYATEISSSNWYKIVNRTDVITARANPADDPCGYRSLLTIKLASMYYNDSELWNNFMSHHTLNKPWASGASNLLAPLQLGEIDYAFIYKSQALQHNLNYISLPDQINLGNHSFNDFYQQAKVYYDSSTGELRESPGDGVTEKTGRVIWYGVTIPLNTKNYDLALNFVKFMLNATGMNIIENICYQPVINPPQTKNLALLPLELQTMVIENPEL